MRTFIGAGLLGLLVLAGAARAESQRPSLIVAHAALEQTAYTRSYDPAYVRIAYPNGDPPRDRGVCSDVIVRAFRAAGVDLQKEIHEDMLRSFAAYPHRWGLAAPDANIDHRRVPNLMTFFTRQGKSLPVSARREDYAPGDVVAWDLGGGLLHVGLVSDAPAAGGAGYAIVHNIGAGAQLEDVLLNWKIIGHYRYFR
ncbi:MAG TPA: DUF1287 domain-containing protein [Stellaceae bacterium]|nr:DUF1287 domain-containing protein [Stellaceae bacterium]